VIAPVWRKRTSSSSAENGFGPSTGTRPGSNFDDRHPRFRNGGRCGTRILPTPTAPLPMITIEAGTSFRWMASSLVIIRVRFDRDPRDASRPTKPVADNDFLNAASSVLGIGPSEHVPRLPWTPSRGARCPLIPIDLVLLEQELDPFGKAARRWRSLTGAFAPAVMSNRHRGPRRIEMPHSLACCTIFQAACACSSRALVRDAIPKAAGWPPSAFCFLDRPATFRPSWAAADGRPRIRRCRQPDHHDVQYSFWHWCDLM